MKTIFNYSLSTLCLVMLALSCQKAQEVIVPEENPNLVTLSCAFPTLEDQNGTKVMLSAAGKTAWEADVDQIVFQGCPKTPEEASIAPIVHTFTSAELSNPEVASFSVDLSSLRPDSDDGGLNHDYNVAYPASIWSSYSSSHMYGRSSFSNTNKMLMAGYVDGSNIVLHHVTAAITFKIAGTAGDYDSYTFEGNGDNAIVGYSKLVVEVNKPKVTSYRKKYKTSSSGTSNPLTVISGDLVSDGSTVNTIFLPVNTKRSGDGSETPYTYDGENENEANVTYLPNGFTIKLLKGGAIKKYITSTKPLTIRPGHMINLGEIPSAAIHDYVAPSTHDSSIPTSGATALDASGNANCYIVDSSNAENKGKVFTFKAYKGNSDTGVGVVASADIIWETWNNSSTVTKNSVVADVDFEKKDGVDYYTMVLQMPATLHAGNALIAAKDAGGNILWSWHIWVPSTAIVDVDASNICGATMMDRNLGALENVSTTDGANVYTLGMIYQWGRKDPFPGGKRITDAWPSPATVAGTAPSVNAGSMTMDEAIAHPTVFGSVEGGDWQTTTDNTRWSASSKSINDPCPPGYKIPYGERNTKPLWSTSDIATAATNAGLTWELSSTGYWFKIADGAKEIVFPLAGYVSDGTSSYGIGYTQTRAAIWCLSESSSKYHLNVRSGTKPVFGSTSASRGCSVRCVVE